ncbi:MAG: hypothetical protein KAH48_05430 [Chlorobi bacterium]|nr:hypothetical protein [Chlorobiota bacterium]
MKMFSRTLSLIALISIVLLTSCDTADKQSELLDKVITNDNLAKIADEIKDDPLITKDEIDYFVNSLAKYYQNKDSLIGNSVGYLIEKEKLAVRNTSVLLMVTAATKAEMLMKYYVRVIKIEKLFNTKTEQKLNRIHYDFTNIADKDITAIDGMMQFYTSKNQLIKQFELKINKDNEVIKKDETKQFYESFLHNDDDPKDAFLREGKDIQARWQPISVEFADGTKLSIMN